MSGNGHKGTSSASPDPRGHASNGSPTPVVNARMRRARQRALMIAVDRTGEATLDEMSELLSMRQQTQDWHTCKYRR